MHTLSSMSGLADEPIGLTSKDVLLPLVPMFHVHSWGMPYMAIMKGLKYVLPGRYDFDRIIDLMVDERVTLSAMVPSILYMIINNPKAEKLKDLNLKTIIGGGALPIGLRKAAEAFNITAISGYGLSETAPILTLATYNSAVRQMKPEERLSAAHG